MKTRFGDLSKVSLTNRIIAAIAIISLIGLVGYIAIPEESSEETLEVYSFEVEGEVTIRCEEPTNYTQRVSITLEETCPVIIYPVNKILYLFLNIEKGTVQITSQLQINETELIWSITVTGVIANTSQGFIKCQELEQVSFLPPRTIITIAFFDFLLETYLYKGHYHVPLDLPPLPPPN